MWVVVKQIKGGTVVDKNGHRDAFTATFGKYGMAHLIGKRISVEPLPGHKGWYNSNSPKDCEGFNWHKSWLRFARKAKKVARTQREGGV